MNRTILATTGSFDQGLQLANGPTKISQVTQESGGEAPYVANFLESHQQQAMLSLSPLTLTKENKTTIIQKLTLLSIQFLSKTYARECDPFRDRP